MLEMFGSFIISYILMLILMPQIIPVFHRFKFGQTVREEGLESHKVKSGTPTMGGAVFIVVAIVTALGFNFANITSPELWILTLTIFGFGAIGLIDDALIVIKKSNKGLPAWLKFGLQAVLTVGLYFLCREFIEGFDHVIDIPLIKAKIDLGYLYPVMFFVMFTGASNGVNLSDGLDGLATGLTMIAIAPFVIFSYMTRDAILTNYCIAVIGALVGFMMFNYHPARIFMGDVGSLGLGGFLAIIAVLTRQELMLVIVGMVYLIETLSVIIQVVSFKTRGKRVFKMAPIHHHFEMVGFSETQVVLMFWAAGFVFGIIGIILGVM